MIDWNNIDSVFLDMDGTLLDLHFDNYFWLTHLPERYSDIKGIPKTEANKTLLQLIKQEEGTLNWYCLDFWTEKLGVDITQLKQEIQHLIAFRPHVKTFLQELQDTRHRVVLVTNAHNKGLNLKLSITGLDHYVDAIICSHDLKLPKENPQFWQKLQTVEPFDKERTLLIDDSLAVLKSAKTYGIQHIYSIVQPDSQKPPRENDEFPAIERFDHHLTQNINR
ncbi:GMP/IMP nucleotidase [Alkalimarinus coralli]|uniref:GMP/IMP nucleotidase n=1 Tax=Alkalimarinus coralli TaxID=2935863 RepID=UPI00202B8A14|nr:GMP/IMP nucleotidase [Alkalimarinus coralli]